MAVSLDIDLQIKIEEAVRQSAKASTQISKQLEGITGTADRVSKAVSLINFAGIAFVATKAAQAIGDVFGKAIDEAVEADGAIRRLNNALVLSGDFSESASQSFADLADEIERTTKFTAEAALSAAAIGKRFNLTNGETEDLVKAAADLAVVLGTDLETAAQQLGQTFDGTAGRLSEQIPALRSLSKEALQAGEAIKVVNDNFGGTASKDVTSFSGSLNQAQKAFGNIFEEIGNIVVQNSAFSVSLQTVAAGLQNVADFIRSNFTDIQVFVLAAVQTLAQLTEGVLKFSKVTVQVLGLALIPFELIYEIAVALVKTLSQLFTLDFKNFGNAFTDIVKRVDGFGALGIAKALDEGAKGAGELSKKLDQIEITENTRLKINKDLNSEFDRQQKIKERQKLNAEDLLKLSEKEAAAAKKIADEESARIQKFNAFIQARSKNPFAQEEGAQTNRLGLSDGARSGVAAGVGLASNVLRGRQGAVNLVSQGAELAGQAFLGVPGLGEIVGLLSQGPDAVRQLIREFADAVPDIIVAVAESIPVVFETLADKLPEIIEKLVERAPRIIEALVKSAPAFTVALSKSFATAGFKLIEELLKGAGKFVGEILRGAGEFVSRLLASIGEGLNRIVNEILKAIDPSKILGGGGGGGDGGLIGGLVGGVVGAIGGLFGKSGTPAGGGFTQSKSGFEGGTQPMNVVVKVGQRELAQAMVELSKQGFRTA